MATDHEHKPLHAENPDVEAEGSDVNIGGIFGFGAGLALCTALVALVLYGAFNAMKKGFTEVPENTNALVGTQEPQVPEKMPAAFPAPRLQTDYFGDLAKMRAEWNEQLDTYGWVDKNAGVVHIPIDDAIALTAQRGLPARPAEQPSGAASPNQTPRTMATKTVRKITK